MHDRNCIHYYFAVKISNKKRLHVSTAIFFLIVSQLSYCCLDDIMICNARTRRNMKDNARLREKASSFLPNLIMVVIIHYKHKSLSLYNHIII